MKYNKKCTYNEHSITLRFVGRGMEIPPCRPMFNLGQQHFFKNIISAP